MTSALNQILALADIGFHVFPGAPNDRYTAFKGARLQATTDEKVIRRWFDTFPGCSWHAGTGESKIIVLDIDTLETHAHEGQIFFKHESCPVVKTPGGGKHYYFRKKGDWNLKRNYKDHPSNCWLGIDIICNRAAITLPPSTCNPARLGIAYEWEVSPFEVAIPNLPSEIIEMIKAPPRNLEKGREGATPLSNSSQEVVVAYINLQINNAASASKGERNRMLYDCSFKAACMAFKNQDKISPQEVSIAMVGAGQACGLDKTESENAVRSGFENARKEVLK